MVLSLEKYAGQIAVVTGASEGIGSAISKKLVKAGLKVVGLARRLEKLETLSKSFEEERGQFYAFQTDITKEEDVVKAFHWIETNLGPIHVLINNAGVIRQTNLYDGDSKLWREVIDTNVLGLCIATREAIRNMEINKVAGHIIHINSLAGHFIPHNMKLNIYMASKYAVTALTETLRQELNASGNKIKISSISPGIVDTDIVNASYKRNGLSPVEEENFLKVIPSLKAEDIADSVVYILSTPSHVQVHDIKIRPVGDMVH